MLIVFRWELDDQQVILALMDKEPEEDNREKDKNISG